MQLVKLQQRTKEWMEFRRSHICASDAPVIMGDSPYKKIEKLYEEKIKCYEQPPNPAMIRGNNLEPLALKAFEKETGIIMFPCVGKHENGWMAASFDGMTIEEDCICEIKCSGKKDHSDVMIGMVPKKYMAQVQHQIYVSGLDFSYYYSFDGQKGVILEVKRDEDFIEKMIEKEKEFWQCLKTLTPPICQPKQRKKHATATPIISGTS